MYNAGRLTAAGYRGLQSSRQTIQTTYYAAADYVYRVLSLSDCPAQHVGQPPGAFTPQSTPACLHKQVAPPLVSPMRLRNRACTSQQSPPAHRPTCGQLWAFRGLFNSYSTSFNQTSMLIAVSSSCLPFDTCSSNTTQPEQN